MTAPEQLTIDGTYVPHPLPAPKRLTPRQRDLWLWAAMAPTGVITTREARRFYADAGGALRRLEAFGAMAHIGHGKWRAT